jgi:hypothetical protein
MLLVKVEEARKQGKPQAEIDELKREQFRARLKRMDGAAYLTSTYLVATAEKCLIPVPEFTEQEVAETFRAADGRGAKWHYLERIDLHILNEDVERELRVAIRAHRKERLEMWRLWITTIVTALTGLIGGLIGLLSIILAHR